MCPIRGSGPALQDLLADNIPIAIDTVALLLPHIRSGGLRALGVATLERNPSLPPCCRRSPLRCRAS